MADEIITKPHLLFATPRTGSWSVYRLIHQHLKKTSQKQGLGELFNPTTHSLWDQNGTLVDRSYVKPVNSNDRARSNANPGSEYLISQVIRKRREFIEATPEQYFFKIFPNDLYHDETTHWLIKNYQWVFLERKDLWAQLLSFLIANHADTWGENPPAQVAPLFSVSRSDFETFEKIIWRYLELKALVKPNEVLFYEDFCQISPQDFLIRAGFSNVKTGPEFVELKGRPASHSGLKENLIQDIQSVRNWYQSSFLSKVPHKT